MQQLAQFVHRSDLYISYRLRTKGYKYPTLKFAMKAVTHLGDGVVIILFPVLLILMGDPHIQKMGFGCLIALFISSMLTCTLKGILRSPRPKAVFFGEKSKEVFFNQYAFPSGHTAASFTVAAFYSFIFPDALILFFLAAMAVGFSRVYLGEHYPSDVLAGAAIGVVISLLFSAIV